MEKGTGGGAGAESGRGASTVGGVATGTVATATRRGVFFSVIANN